jgi:hypothetical protein
VSSQGDQHHDVDRLGVHGRLLDVLEELGMRTRLGNATRLS